MLRRLRMISAIIKEAAFMAARIIENELRSQAPSSKIAKGFSVEPVITESNGEIDVDFNYVLEDKVIYGLYLDSGTLREADPSDDAQFNPDPGKGSGGIKPRYWMNYPQEFQERIDMIIDVAIEAAVEAQIDQDLDQEFAQ